MSSKSFVSPSSLRFYQAAVVVWPPPLLWPSPLLWPWPLVLAPSPQASFATPHNSRCRCLLSCPLRSASHRDFHMFCKRKQDPYWRLQVQVLELPCCLPMLVLKLQLAWISVSCECSFPLPSSQQTPSLTVFYQSVENGSINRDVYSTSYRSGSNELQIFSI